MKQYKNNSGFTLIEVIVYIALFSIIIGGGMIAVYEVIQSTDAGTNHVTMEEEANFLLRKINWALTGATSFTTGSSLSIIKSGSTYVFDLNSGNLQLTDGGTIYILNSSSISVSSLSYNSIGSNGVTTSFTLKTIQNGRNVTESFSTTKYLRQ